MYYLYLFNQLSFIKLLQNIKSIKMYSLIIFLQITILVLFSIKLQFFDSWIF